MDEAVEFQFLENMAEDIDYRKLEDNLKHAIDIERLYELRNEAKLRAVGDQKVASYEEFRNIVDAAHLKPLDRKKDRLNAEPKRIWNPVRVEEKPLRREQAEAVLQEKVVSKGKIMDMLLQGTGLVQQMCKFIREDSAFFPNVFAILLDFNNTETTAQCLLALMKEPRFELNMMMLSQKEKSTARRLLSTLNVHKDQNAVDRIRKAYEPRLSKK